MSVPFHNRILWALASALAASGVTMAVWFQDEVWTIGGKALLELVTGLLTIGIGYSFYVSSGGLIAVRSKAVRIAIAVVVSMLILTTALWVYSIHHPNSMD